MIVSEMINPFTLPESEQDTHGSLCPWREEMHLRYYVPVDNTETAFRSFEGELASWRGNFRRTVLIYGGDGCGKTSLANRCAHAVVGRFDNRSKAFIAHLPDANGAVARTAEQKAYHSLRTFVDQFELVLDFFDPKELDSLRKAEPDAQRMAQLLEAILVKKQRTLVVIQPGLEIPLDFDVFVERFGRRNIVLILETTSREICDHSRVTYGAGAANPVIQLELGRLDEHDCVNYVRARLEMLAKAQADQPAVNIPEAIIKRFTAARTRRTDGLSIREFERICAHLFVVAARRSDKNASYEDIAEYYFNHARI
jgi:hypothetical protein